MLAPLSNDDRYLRCCRIFFVFNPYGFTTISYFKSTLRNVSCTNKKIATIEKRRSSLESASKMRAYLNEFFKYYRMFVKSFDEIHKYERNKKSKIHLCTVGSTSTINNQI